MKSALLLSLALVCSLASADISSPELPKLLAVSCGAPTYTWSVGEQSSDGTYPGLVRQAAHCNLSGRGARVRYYAACARVVWTPDGYLVGDPEMMWSMTSTSPIALAC
jgi:hypothetical protein